MSGGWGLSVVIFPYSKGFSVRIVWVRAYVCVPGVDKSKNKWSRDVVVEGKREGDARLCKVVRRCGSGVEVQQGYRQRPSWKLLAFVLSSFGSMAGTSSSGPTNFPKRKDHSNSEHSLSIPATPWLSLARLFQLQYMDMLLVYYSNTGQVISRGQGLLIGVSNRLTSVSLSIACKPLLPCHKSETHNVHRHSQASPTEHQAEIHTVALQSQFSTRYINQTTRIAAYCCLLLSQPLLDLQSPSNENIPAD